MRRTSIIVLGTLIALMPLLGFPGWFKDIFFVVAGVAIALGEYIRTLVRKSPALNAEHASPELSQTSQGASGRE